MLSVGFLNGMLSQISTLTPNNSIPLFLNIVMCIFDALVLHIMSCCDTAHAMIQDVKSPTIPRSQYGGLFRDACVIYHSNLNKYADT